MAPATQCIGTNEPAFVIAMALGLASAILLARALVRLEARLQGHRHAFAWRSLAWAIAQGVVFVPPVVLVVVGVSWGVVNSALAARRSGRS